MDKDLYANDISGITWTVDTDLNVNAQASE